MKALQALLQKAVSSTFKEKVSVELTRPDEQFGDYATNVALQLSKKVGKNPREVAEQIIAALSQSELVRSAEVAGPGFINIRLTDAALLDAAGQKPTQSLKGKVVVAEYSDPNPFKVLHAGHLYTTIVGDSIARLLENAGAKVHRVNFGGDVGLHVARTMWAILQKIDGEKPEALDTVPKDTRAEWLSERYVEGTAAHEDDPAAKQQIIALNKRIYELHTHKDKTSNFAKIYWTTRQWSYDGFETLYKRLQVVAFDKYYPESETTERGIETVQAGLKQGIFEESEGAVVFRGEEHGLHTRVFLNREGLPTYETKDLGLALHKWQDYAYHKSVIITGNDIIEYMKVVQKVIEKMQPDVPQSDHLTHGMVKLAGGIKMSSRRGNILRAADILDAAQAAAKEASEKEDPDVTLGAVKYALLKARIGGDIIYDPKESVSIHGNSGPYLQYAYVRAKSILGKATKKPAQIRELSKDERSLVRKISEYPEVVERATAELMPHHICGYLYELAQVFNRFYEKNRIIGDKHEAERLGLAQKYADVLSDGLKLLGIPAPEKM